MAERHDAEQVDQDTGERRVARIRQKRAQSLRDERERAARVHAQRRRMEQQALQQSSPPVRPIPQAGLLWPTLKALGALVAVLAAGVGIGALRGLPLPSLASDDSTPAAAPADPLLLSSGTPASLTTGPFHPVLGEVDYGQKDAKFCAHRSGHTHEGQDMFAKKGTPLVAVRDSVVVDRGKVNGRYSGGRGNYVAVYSPLDDRSFVYFHMLEPSPLQIGDRVEAGDPVGKMGCTGTCFGTHVHFEVRVGEARLRAKTKPLDPLPYLRQWPQAAAP